MVKKVIKIGNSHGVIFDSALMELAHLKAGDELNLELHSGGGITLMPLDASRKNHKVSSEEVSSSIQDVMERYKATMKKLA